MYEDQDGPQMRVFGSFRLLQEFLFRNDINQHRIINIQHDYDEALRAVKYTLYWMHFDYCKIID